MLEGKEVDAGKSAWQMTWDEMRKENSQEQLHSFKKNDILENIQFIQTLKLGGWNTAFNRSGLRHTVSRVEWKQYLYDSASSKFPHCTTQDLKQNCNDFYPQWFALQNLA